MLSLEEKESNLSTANQDLSKAKEDNARLQTQSYQDKQEKEGLHMEVDSLRKKLAHANDAANVPQPSIMQPTQ